MKFRLIESIESIDNMGNELTLAQVEFFKNSKVRDNNGKLLVCYHGTNKEFDTFDNNKIKAGTFGNGFYFTTSKTSAKSYGNNIGEYYLNIKNFVEIPEDYEDIVDFVIAEYNSSENINNSEATEILKNKGYDGVMTKMYYGDDNFEYYVAFHSNQIKSIDNKNPSLSNNINESYEVYAK